MSDRGEEAVVEQTGDGVISRWDAAAEVMFGWTQVEALGMRCDRLVPIRNRGRHAASLSAYVASADTGVTWREITAAHRDGGEFRVTTAFSLDADARVVMRVRRTNHRVGLPATYRDDRYLAILDQIEDGCCVVDLRGDYLFVNDSFCRMFGFEREFIVGRNFKASMGAERADKLLELYTRVYTTGEPVKSFEYQVFPKNSPTRYVEQSLSLERDADGKPVAFLAISRDCTARKEAEFEAARAREAAEAANRAKSEFLANMSHEIRTPMNGIIGMTELALDTTLTAYQEDCLNTVRISAESLMTILNDLLDFSKIESRKLTLEAVRFVLADVIGEALKPLAASARQKGIKLLCDVAPDLPASVVGDPVRLKQIVINLIGNAIKFTDQGQVVLSIREESRGVDSIHMHFSVRDTGIGISADKHAAIFEAFHQADGSTTRRFGGTGLGLAISSTLVALMDGRIWVESEPGVGSAFHFTAAFKRAAEGDAVADTSRRAGSRALIVNDDDHDNADSHQISVPPAAGPQPSPVRPAAVLVAEDNVVNQRVVSGLLLRRGHRVVMVSDGQEAVAATERELFDIVLMDVQMPGMGGFEATAAIRARERETGQHVRIVAMTAHAMNGDRERCLAAGMDGYLSKPIDSRLLFDSVEGDPAPAVAVPDQPVLHYGNGAEDR
jgi:PAS domain S-box-containing protein